MIKVPLVHDCLLLVSNKLNQSYLFDKNLPDLAPSPNKKKNILK